jgi:hypothetical protein
MNAKHSLVPAVAFLAALPLMAATGPLSNAKVTSRAVPPGGLARAVRDLGARPAPLWIAWSAPLQDRRHPMCCFDGLAGWQDSGFPRASGRCRLSGRGSVSTSLDSDRVPRLDDPADFLVFVRTASGAVTDVRSFSLDCPIDAEGSEVVWLGEVAADESVAWLATLVPRPATAPAKGSDDEEDEGEDEADVSKAAVGAIAMHQGAAAEAVMAGFLQPDRPAALRKKAAFWLAAGRGRSGCQILVGVVPGDGDGGFRRSGTFALSLCPEDLALPAMIAMARQDPSPKVRGQALFWLAQKAGKRSAAAVRDAIRDDPDTEVKKQAVFALTQMPSGEGVPELIRVARTNRNPEVRERAVFWLGQSNDPRALDFIEDVLSR